MLKNKKFLFFLMCCIAGKALNSPAFAAGFLVNTSGFSQIGAAYGGSTAQAENAASQFFNPAAIGDLKGKQILFGASLIAPNMKPEGNFTSSTVLITPINGRQDNNNASQAAVVPAFYGKFDINDKLKVGFSAHVPWGLSTSYHGDWVGRYHGVTSAIDSFEFAPVVAYKVTPELTVAGGIKITHFKARLTNAADCGLLDATQSLGLGLTPGDTASDCFANVNADDTSAGFIAGLQYQVTPKTRLGFSYSSAVNHELQGDVRYEVPNPALSAILANGGVQADVRTPAILRAGISQDITSKLNVGIDVHRIQWSSMRDITIRFDSGQPDDVTDLNWNNTWFASIGARYQLNDAVTLRGGMAYDESPIPAETRNVRLPGADRTWFTGGVGYTINEALRVDASYLYAFFDDAKVNLAATGNNAGRGALRGEYKTDLHVFSLQLQYIF